MTLLSFIRVDSRLSTCVYKLNLVDRRVRVIARRDALGYAVTEFSPSVYAMFKSVGVILCMLFFKDLLIKKFDQRLAKMDLRACQIV